MQRETVSKRLVSSNVLDCVSNEHNARYNCKDVGIVTVFSLSTEQTQLQLINNPSLIYLFTVHRNNVIVYYPHNWCSHFTIDHLIVGNNLYPQTAIGIRLSCLRVIKNCYCAVNKTDCSAFHRKTSEDFTQVYWKRNTKREREREREREMFKIN